MRAGPWCRAPAWAVIDGVTYRIDVTQPGALHAEGKLAEPNARRIIDLRFQGQPVTDAMPR